MFAWLDGTVAAPALQPIPNLGRGDGLATGQVHDDMEYRRAARTYPFRRSEALQGAFDYYPETGGIGPLVMDTPDGKGARPSSSSLIREYQSDYAARLSVATGLKRRLAASSQSGTGSSRTGSDTRWYCELVVEEVQAKWVWAASEQLCTGPLP